MALDLKKIEQLNKQVNINQLRKILRSLENKINRGFDEFLNQEITESNKQQFLSQTQDEIRKSDTEIKNWLIPTIATFYLAGYTEVNNDLIRANFRASGVDLKFKPTFNDLISNPIMEVHKQSVNTILSDSYIDFASGMNGLQKNIEHRINDAVKQQINRKLIDGRLTGQSIQNISSDVKQLLAEQGFTSLTDRGGNRWSLERYSEMLTRTHTIKASAEGTVNRSAELGIDLVEWLTADSPCEICDPRNGVVYSVSGNSKEYEKLPDLPGEVHPNCKCAIAPRPDIVDSK